MAFRQQHRPQSARQISYHAPESAEPTTLPSQQTKPLEQSEEWVLFSPVAPSTTARTHTTSTERTPRTAGLSRFSEFGSLDTAARSDHDDDVGTFLGTEEGEELDSLDDGLHAFHEPSEYGAPAGKLMQSGDTVLPTHDGLGGFQPNAAAQEHMWQFERPRRRAARRRSSVQRHFIALDDTDEVTQEQERRQRIEQWRLEQSKALLEEIEKETRRRRRLSMASVARSRAESVRHDSVRTAPSMAASSVDAHSESSEEGTEHLSFWQRITRRVIRDLIGLDDNTLSVIFGEALPEENGPKSTSQSPFSADKALQEAGIDASTLMEDSWQTKLLERVAQELGSLVHQLSEHPGAFSTYQRTQSIPEYAGLNSATPKLSLSSELPSSHPTYSQSSFHSPASAQFAPSFPAAQNTYSDASLWGIEEEPRTENPLDRLQTPNVTAANIVEDLEREREYWERDLDVKMIFNFLLKRFSNSRAPISSPPGNSSNAQASSTVAAEPGADSARRAAIIRQHHPLVDRTTDRALPTSSSSHVRETKRKDVTYRTYYTTQNVNTLRHSKLRSSSSCASQSTKKSKRSGGSGRNYWDLGGSVGSGSVLAGEV